MTKPNFLVIGAMKAGTTSLHWYLKQHPSIYMIPKQTNFWAINFDEGKPDSRRFKVTSIEAYQDLFRGVTNETAIGEVSPLYLASPVAPNRIKQYIPDVKLIAILRNPADRFYSHYLMQVRKGKEKRQINQIISDFLLNKDCDPIIYGFYYTHLKRYFKLFKRNQIRIYLFEDFKNNPIEVLQDIFGFLGIEQTFVPDTSYQYGYKGIPKNQSLYALLASRATVKIRRFLGLLVSEKLMLQFAAHVKRRITTKPQPLLPEARQQLTQIYQEDILKLQDLTQRELTKWLN